MNFFDSEIAKAKEKRAELEVRVKELDSERSELISLMDEIDFVIDVLKGKVVPIKKRRATTKPPQSAVTKAKRKKPKNYQKRIIAVVAGADHGMIPRKDIVKKLGGSTSGYRALKALLDRGDLRTLVVDEREMIALPLVAKAS